MASHAFAVSCVFVSEFLARIGNDGIHWPCGPALLEASWFRELAFRFLHLGHARRFAWSVCSLLGFWLLGKHMERGSQPSKGAWQLW